MESGGAWQVLEPIMTVEVMSPTEFQGSAMGLVTKRNGIVVNSEVTEEWTTITAEIPLNDMFGFATDLRSQTQGKGEFAMEYARYAPAGPEASFLYIQFAFSNFLGFFFPFQDLRLLTQHFPIARRIRLI
jgi:translation elongation factor EF-G